MEKSSKPMKAYENFEFMNSPDARLLRILAEMLEPMHKFRKSKVRDSIAFFGSARTLSKNDANILLKKAQRSGNQEKTEDAKIDLSMSKYYEDARLLAKKLTEWSIKNHYEYYICSGGGPGIMEAANRGAADVPHGKSIGLNICLPFEQEPNPYITDEFNFEFNYFFIRKFWFTYLAKAVIAFPGGFGTFDEFFELMTLIQTKKTTKTIPIVLYGTEFWNEVVNFDALVKYRVISKADLDLFLITDNVEEAFTYITLELEDQRTMHPQFYKGSKRK